MSESLELVMLTVGSWQENCYIARDRNSGQCIVIDPGDEADRILATVGSQHVAAIMLTHAHGDHVGAVEAVRAATGAKVHIHPAEAAQLAPIKADELITDGDSITLGDHRLGAIHTPGHTPGMITFLLPDNRAVVGDTIFAGGPGRTWSADDFRATLDTLRLILTWPDETVCYPGHGPSFQLGNIRSQIAAFVDRPHPTGFYGDAEW